MNIEKAVRSYIRANHPTIEGTTSDPIKIVLGGLNSSPANQASLAWTGGPGPDIDVPLEDVTFQYMIRHGDYDKALAKINQVKAALHATSFTSEGIVFRSVFAIGSGGPLGRDEQGLHRFSINFQANVINNSLKPNFGEEA